MLGNLIHVAEIPNPSAEDIFSSAMGLLFPDDTSALHGDPGSLVTYKSERFGDIELRLSRLETEDDRRLFAQYLWNGGVLLAEIIGSSRVSNIVGNNEKIEKTTTVVPKMRID